MDIFNSSIELVRIVFLIGAVFVLIYKKQFGITPGGIIVPGILSGLLFRSYIIFIITVFSAGVCWAIYKLFISRFALSNRWTSLSLISISILLGLFFLVCSESLRVLDQEVLLSSLVAPGLISICAKKYGFNKTIYATLTVAAITSCFGLLLAYVIPYNQLTLLSVQLAVYTPLTIVYPMVVLPISLVAVILAYYRFGIRSGGYMIAPFIAVVIISSPIQAILLAIGIALSYLAVKLIQKHTLIIGLERFVLSLFCGYFVITLIDFLAIYIDIPGYRPSPIILIVAIAVMTNDLSLQPILPTLKKGFAPSILISLIARMAI